MSKMTTSSKTTRRPLRPMTQRQVEDAAKSDRDNRPLSPAYAVPNGDLRNFDMFDLLLNGVE